MLAALKAYYLEQMARPGAGALFLNPFYFARKGLLDAVQELGPQVSGRTLDVGCGNRPYERFFRSSEYVGLELDTPENRRTKRADVYYDGKLFPFESKRFDSVVCNQVLEHAFEPEAFLAEIGRVLRPAGTLLLTVPFAWDEHEQPRDYARYSSFGLRALLERCGFEVLVHEKTMADIRAVGQLFNAYLFKVTSTRWPYLNALLALLFMAPVNISASLLRWVTPRNPDMYLDNVIIAKKVERK